MAIDPVSTAAGIARLIFVQDNAPATLTVDDLQTLATAIDAQMTANNDSFIAALPPDLVAALTAEQVNQAIAYVGTQRTTT
jgi:hypothetical protein